MPQITSLGPGVISVGECGAVQALGQEAAWGQESHRKLLVSGVGDTWVERKGKGRKKGLFPDTVSCGSHMLVRKV